jgi:hypothetical protein
MTASLSWRSGVELWHTPAELQVVSAWGERTKKKLGDATTACPEAALTPLAPPRTAMPIWWPFGQAPLGPLTLSWPDAAS